MAIGMRRARERRLLFNMSAGAAGFKRNRGARPAIEYAAVYNRHLPWKSRAAAAIVRAVLAGSACPPCGNTSFDASAERSDGWVAVAQSRTLRGKPMRVLARRPRRWCCSAPAAGVPLPRRHLPAPLGGAVGRPGDRRRDRVPLSWLALRRVGPLHGDARPCRRDAARAGALLLGGRKGRPGLLLDRAREQRALHHGALGQGRGLDDRREPGAIRRWRRWPRTSSTPPIPTSPTRACCAD